MFRCPLCQRSLEIRETKKEKPYLTCESCGLQMFVRYRKGIQRLEDLSRNNVSLMENYVVCHGCRIAVEKCSENVSEPFFVSSGIYCPVCDELLLKKEAK